MTLTKQQNQELDSLKQQIESIEKKIENSRVMLEVAREIESKEELNKHLKAIAYGSEKIKDMVSMQSKSMKLHYDIVIDLIFDREYTLNELRNIN